MAKAKRKKTMKTPPIVSAKEWEAARQQLNDNVLDPNGGGAP